LQNIFDSWETITLSEGTIKHFHKELLSEVDKDERHRGEYKKTENKVRMIDAEGASVGVLFDTTPAYLTPKEMQELLGATHQAYEENKYHPLLIIGNFIVEFLHIHPFEDGNGRLSRVLTNLLFLKSGYGYIPYVSHEKLIEVHKADYYVALRQTQKTLRTDTPDLKPWLHFFLSVIHEQAVQAIGLLSRENIEKTLSAKQLAVWEYIQTVDEASPAEIAKHANVARATVNQVLNKLLRLKQIERIGLGRSTRYRKC